MSATSCANSASPAGSRPPRWLSVPACCPPGSPRHFPRESKRLPARIALGCTIRAPGRLGILKAKPPEAEPREAAMRPTFHDELATARVADLHQHATRERTAKAAIQGR